MDPAVYITFELELGISTKAGMFDAFCSFFESRTGEFQAKRFMDNHNCGRVLEAMRWENTTNGTSVTVYGDVREELSCIQLQAFIEGHFKPLLLELEAGVLSHFKIECPEGTILTRVSNF